MEEISAHGTPRVYPLTGRGLYAKKVFTTGQVATICKVAPRTVNKWFDSGRLRGYRIPGSQDRRVPRECLLRFLREHDMPSKELEDGELRHVLLYSQDVPAVDRFREAFGGVDGIALDVARSGFEAGMLANQFQPEVVLIDLSVGRFEALALASQLRREEWGAEALLLALGGEVVEQPEELTRAGFDAAFVRPLDVGGLAGNVRQRMYS